MMELPTTAYAVGWYEFGARPADRAGTTVLAGHVDTKAEGLGPLAALRRVDEGTEIALTAVDGTSRRYSVTDVKVGVQRVRATQPKKAPWSAPEPSNRRQWPSLRGACDLYPVYAALKLDYS